MKDLPLVSVIVNNYNYARYVGAAIESALAQTYPRTEVVVVDDGSTDASRAVIAGFGDRVVPVFKPNGGQGSAFNAGFAASSGAIVMFLDADDVLMPEAVASVVEAFGPGVSNVQFRLRVIDKQGAPQPGLVPPAELPLTTGDTLPAVLSGRTVVSPFTSGHAFARATLQAILPMPTEPWRITADCYLMTLAPFFGPVVSLEGPLGFYRIHGENHWAGSGPGVEAMLREIRFARQRAELIREWSRSRGLSPHPLLEFQRAPIVSAMVAVKVLAPERDPVPERSLGWLCRQGIRVLRGERHPSAIRRLGWGGWLAAVAVVPRPLAEALVTWRQARQARPKASRAGAGAAPAALDPLASPLRLPSGEPKG